MVLVRPDESRSRRWSRRNALTASGAGAQPAAGRLRSRRDPPADGACDTASTTGSISGPPTRSARRRTRSSTRRTGEGSRWTRRRWCCSSSAVRSARRWRSRAARSSTAWAARRGRSVCAPPERWDGELAYLLAPQLSKRTLYTGGALDPAGALEITDLASLWSSPAQADGWAALIEGAAKAVRGLQVSVPAPHEIVVSGRLARLPELVAALGSSLRDVAPVVTLIPGRASSAAYGGALLADALAGGPQRGSRRCRSGCASQREPRSTICAWPVARRFRWADSDDPRTVRAKRNPDHHNLYAIRRLRP